MVRVAGPLSFGCRTSKRPCGNGLESVLHTTLDDDALTNNNNTQHMPTQLSTSSAAAAAPSALPWLTHHNTNQTRNRMVRLVATTGSSISTPLAYTPPMPLTKEGLHALNAKPTTLIGFGSLLSETSSRTTFPSSSTLDWGVFKATGVSSATRLPFNLSGALLFKRPRNSPA